MAQKRYLLFARIGYSLSMLMRTSRVLGRGSPTALRCWRTSFIPTCFLRAILPPRFVASKSRLRHCSL